MLKINKILIAILLLSVFTVGTLSFTDTVNAAVKTLDNENKEYSIESKEKSVKWKRYDSGSFIDNDPISGFKKRHTYTAHIKGSQEIRMQIHGYRTKNNKKELLANIIITKTSLVLKDGKGKTFDKSSFKSTNVKTTYRYVKQGFP